MADREQALAQCLSIRTLLAIPKGHQPPKRRASAVLALALLLVSYFGLIHMSTWPSRLRYPGEEDAAEGTQLAEMVHLRQGIQIYRLPSKGSFDGAIYGPLSYLLGAAIIDPNHPAYAPLRLLSLAATLGVTVASAVFAFKLAGSKSAGILAALMLLSMAFIARYGISARADMVALLLAFAGFLIFYSFRESRRALILSAVLMLLSLFYKQQFVGAPIAVFLYLVLDKRFRQAWEFATTMAAGSLILIAVFSYVIFPGQFFLVHFISYNRLLFDQSRLLPEILMFVIPLFVPLLGSTDFLTDQQDRLVSSYVAVSVSAYFLLLLSSGPGADTNRCLEPAVVLSCVLAARIATARGILPGLTWVGALATTLALVALLNFAFVVPRVRAQDFAADFALQRYLREEFPRGTSALCYFAGDPIRAGLDVPVTNLWHYSALIRKGALTDNEILSRIDRGEYGVILLDFDVGRFESSATADFYTTRSMRDAIVRAYQPVARLRLPGPETSPYTDGYIYVWTARSKRTNKSLNETLGDV
jgi:hypothetical protein